jgi:hypothetical protein
MMSSPKGLKPPQNKKTAKPQKRLTVVAYVDPQAGDWLFGCQGVKVGGEGKTGCWYIFHHPLIVVQNICFFILS